MALASLSTLGTLADKTSAPSISLTPANQLNAGEIGMIVVCVDNNDTSNGPSNFITSVTDSAGNTWIKGYEQTVTQGGSPDDGATAAIFWTKATSNVPTSGSIVAHFAVAKVAKCIGGWRFSIGAGNTLQQVAQTALSNDSIDPPALSTSGLANVEHLHVRLDAAEGGFGAETYTPSTNFTAMFGPVATSGAAGATNMSILGAEFRINTSTGESTDPAFSVAAKDSVSILVGFAEVAAEISLDAQPGSYALTAQGANPVIAAPAAPASYALAGAVASFALGLPASPGAFAWSGAAAGLPADYVLAASPGALAWSGAVATSAIAMPASPGAVAWSGAPADLVHTSGLTLDAQPGAFVLTGQAASAAIGANAAPGAYAHAGMAAGFLLELPGNAGAVAWSGAQASLLAGYVLAASPGAVAWSGAPAELLVLTLTVPAEGFTLPGRAVMVTLPSRGIRFDLLARPTNLVNPKEK